MSSDALKVDKEQVRLFVRLIGGIFTGEKVVIDSDVSWENMYAFAKLQHTVPLFYYAANKQGVALPERVAAACKKQSDMLSAQSLMQQLAYGEINAAFKKRGVKFCHIKGAILKNAYADAAKDEQVYYLRPSSDIDVLIDKDSFGAAAEALKEIGFEFDHGGEVHDSYCRGAVSVEMHRFLYNESTGLYAFNDEIWNIIYSQDDCEYIMPPWYCYVTLLTHYYKHFAAGGCGLRYLLDIWLYRKTRMSDEDYTRAEEYLKRMKLDIFSRASLEAAEYIFADGEYKKIHEDVCEYLASSGIYGTFSRSSINEGIERGAGKTFISRVFPSLKTMRQIYPNLKAPLLPFYWIRRIFRILFTRKRDVRLYLGLKKRVEAEKQERSMFFTQIGIEGYGVNSDNHS